MTAVDAEVIANLLLRAEKKIAAKGWDQRPALATIELREKKYIGLAEMAIIMQQPVPQFVRFVADQLLSGEKQQLARKLGSPTFYGVAFICEAWMGTEMSTEEMQRIHNSNVRLESLPGSKETRMITAVDIYGRPYMINRVRGENATVTARGSAESLGGQVIESIRRLTLAIARQMPDNGDYITDLETTFIPTVEDIATAEHHRKSREATGE